MGATKKKATGTQAQRKSSRRATKTTKTRRKDAKTATTPRAKTTRATASQTTKVKAEAVREGEGDSMFTDDPVMDRRIIEGMLEDKEGFLAAMNKQGFPRAAVLRRAADLGLSEAFLRQIQGVAADLAGDRPGARRLPRGLAARRCLSCERVFLSGGPGNRLCMRCRGGDAGLAQL